ncbi:Aspartic proteinase CDR1-like [Quillaja saponaria]|uniref:Aspartic proteinase CDR1-like n=1 Tax=Quillaja saponaria TaxID=32244 RepID=A0AAD7PF76_QUISA|nr:Aspartic proteinase CDR1-like [Quillaja saponaria]
MLKFCSFFLIFSFTTFLSLPPTLPSGFSTDLIHHNSPLSPFYKPFKTPAQYLRDAAFASISCVNQLQKLEEEGDEKDNIVSTVVTSEVAIDKKLLSLTQETPPHTKKSPAVPAFVRLWSLVLLAYGDQSTSSGDIATDTFTFNCNAGEVVSFPRYVFGCGHRNVGKYPKRGAGLIGLGAGPESLISQLGDKISRRFSYCLFPFDSVNSTSKFKFGDDAILTGHKVVSTPLVLKSFQSVPTFYELNLEGIRVGNKTVLTKQTEAGIIIDSGTTLTILKSSFYHNVAAAVKEAIGADPEPNPPEPFTLCWNPNSSYGFTLPEMVFQFTDADLVIKNYGIFAPYEGLVCMLIEENPTISIFGSMVQVDMQVEYNIQEGKVSFAPANCSN